MTETRPSLQRTSILRSGLTSYEPTRSAGNADSENSSAGFSLVALAPAQRWSLRLDPAIASELSDLDGFAIDQPINMMTGSTDIAMRLGPDEWLLIASQIDNEREPRLASLLAPHIHSLVDVSHRNVAFELSGTAAAEILNAGCPLDLDEQGFGANHATRTILGKVEIILARPAGGDGFRIEVWRSFARHIEALLVDAARLTGAVR